MSRYDVSNISAPRAWGDRVGKKLTRTTQVAVDRFNPAHKELAQKIGPLLDIREDDISYNSQRYEIEREWVDE